MKRLTKEQFLSRVAIAEGNQCWEWLGSIGKDDYGYVSKERRWVHAHRAAHELFIGRIPDGFEVDHLCRNRSCVRPDHLEAVTPAENGRRRGPVGVAVTNAAKTHCVNGHEFNEQNTYFRPNGFRDCRECMRQAQRRCQARKRSEAA